MDGKIIIEELMEYAKDHLDLAPIDEIYFKNVLLSKLKVDSPYEGEKLDLSYIKDLDRPDLIVNKLKEYLLENKIVNEEYLDIFIVDIFGILSPLPSKINEEFIKLIKESPQKACDYLFNLSIANYYIQKTAIEKNLMWTYKPTNSNKYLEITINLSKPEKNNKDTAKLLTIKQDKKYPLCLLCKENEGYEGTLTHPARRNIRTIKLKLNGENWFMQYSPYAYYNEHCIVINEEHHQMKIDETTPIKLVDFVDYLPNYFIGSNACLPIVGGSILNHEHFQGGLHLMPMHYATIRKHFTSSEFSDLELGILDWYNSAIQINGKNKENVIKLAQKIIKTWENYDDLDNEILSHTDNTPHNTVSPILRKENDIYKFTIILRNNRCNEKYPDGIFHVHPEYHNIKKESIGLIEAMGLFILPGRLKRQFNAIEDMLCGKTKYDETSLNKLTNDLFVHKDMIKKLFNTKKCITKEEANKLVIDYVNDACTHILENTAVFKDTPKGQQGFEKFLNNISLTAM